MAFTKSGKGKKTSESVGIHTPAPPEGPGRVGMPRTGRNGKNEERRSPHSTVISAKHFLPREVRKIVTSLARIVQPMVIAVGAAKSNA